MEDSSAKESVNGLSDNSVKKRDNKKFELSHETLESNISSVNIITDEMWEVEKLLEEKNAREEIILKEKMAKEAAEKKFQEEQCYKRLHLLLSRSSIYAKFMAEKLKKDESKVEQKRLNSVKTGEQKSKPSYEEHTGKSLKRKKSDVGTTDANTRKKNCKSLVSIVDAFKKQNTAENITEKYQTDYCNSALDSVNGETISALHPVLFTGGTMREYQIEGYEWLKVLFENGVNGILADEMGLGKTIQCIAFIAHLIEMGVPGPFFVCAPLSTILNWYSEFKRFAPNIPVMVYHGHKSERHGDLLNKIRKKVKFENFFSYPVVITTYQMALIDKSKLSSLEWKLLIVDEAHRIKNFQCRLVSALKMYNAVDRLLLTGTPLQNNLSELWSLLNFILPEIFDDLQVFESWFDITNLTEKGATQEIVAQEQEKQIISIIHQILTPFLLRRTKSDVELQLPSKKEVVVHAPLTAMQQKYYTGVLNKTIKKLFGCDKSEEISFDLETDKKPSRKLKKKFEDLDLKKLLSNENFEELTFSDTGNVADTSDVVDTSDVADTDVIDSKDFYIYLNLRNITMCLRKICNHPYLLSYPLDHTTGGFKIDEDLVRSSGKLLILDAMLPELKKRGHKVLIFSQFVGMINILEDYCIYRSYAFNTLIGSMSLDKRDVEIKEFNTNKNSFLFLISTRAGGLGINLTAADTVIIYDSDWNPQSDLQAQDRCHRIGQIKPVVVYRLIIPNTVDEKIINRAATKRKLEKVIIQKGRFNSKDTLNKSQKAITKEELLELLEASDINGFVKTDDNYVISPVELEKLLERSDS